MFARTPFLNGGLFDSLDRKLNERIPEDAKLIENWQSGVRSEKLMIRMEGFSDRDDNPLKLPNDLFFSGNEREPGLINLLKQYQFTLVESTPLDVEVALDPELLGKVFENLLADYNPETRDSARKQTGSYYTPRNVVDFMVSESLVEIIVSKVHPEDGDVRFFKERLQYLLDYAEMYNDADELFVESERKSIIRAIAEIKILDPAIGSGAFPMGVLHKLTLALRRLDPINEHWEVYQKTLAGLRAKEAFDTNDRYERETELLEISGTFDKYRESDFGRKLYLIQNSIYGVDVQPIAGQIAKLRFFISLAIEQEPDFNAKDFGIRPLPNLETRFVAADTLVGINNVPVFVTDEVKVITARVAANRERYFNATIPEKKASCRDVDSQLRSELYTALMNSGMPVGDAQKVAAWDPFNQNVQASWFDPKYMFNIEQGFDLVIGNPPYVESRNNLLKDKAKDAYQNQVIADWGDSLPRGSDLLMYFYVRATKFLAKVGHGCLITQNAWLSTDYGKKFQEFSVGRFSFPRIIDTSTKFFLDTKSQNINTVITFFGKQLAETIDYSVADKDLKVSHIKSVSAKTDLKWGHLFAMPLFIEDILKEMIAGSGPSRGVKFGQGLNFTKTMLNSQGANIPVVVKDTTFVATSPDGRIASTVVKRKGRIPALLMPRGVGNRYYCTFNECRAYSYSHVELYLPDPLWGKEYHYGLWAFMNSSFVWLFREITGRKNLGGGLLKAEATDMKVLPVDFDFNFAGDAMEVFNTIRNREPLPVWDEVRTNEHLHIDDMVATFFDFGGKQEQIRNALLEQTAFRIERPRSLGTVKR